MIAYKLLKIRKDGSIGSLFINAREKYEMGKWMDCQAIKKKGFAFRPGWHCTVGPFAPHLSMNGRAWFEVEVEDFEFYDRPESQGGKWILAKKIKINNRIS